MVDDMSLWRGVVATNSNFNTLLVSCPCVATGNKTIGIAIHGACNKTNIPIFVSILNDIFHKCNNSSKYFHKILALIITSKTQ
jgi:hypothetical protein